MADDDGGGTASGICHVCGVKVTYDEYDPGCNVGVIEGDDEEVVMCDEHGALAEDMMMADETTPETRDCPEAAD